MKDPSEVDDAISETLTGSMVADNIIADWQRTGVEHLTNTDDEVEEGCVFHSPVVQCYQTVEEAGKHGY